MNEEAGLGNGDLSGSSQELLQTFRRDGLQEPFEEIVRRYAGMVFHVCLQITKNTHDAEDATQAVFLTLAIQAKTGKEIKAVGPWLQQVAYRLSLDLRKSKKRREIREGIHCDIARANGQEFAPDSSAAPGMDELKSLMAEEMQNLPAKYRLPLILHYFGGLSREEIARELKCKPSTLGVRLFRGREMLGNRLTDRGIMLTGGVLGVALAYSVQATVQQSMLSATCSAATQIAAGYQPSTALISSQVIGLTRAAVHAIAVAKVKTVAAVLLLAGSALAAGMGVVAKVAPLELHLDLPLNFRSLFQGPSAPMPQVIDRQNRPDNWASLAVLPEGTSGMPAWPQRLGPAPEITPSVPGGVRPRPVVRAESLSPVAGGPMFSSSREGAILNDWLPGRIETASLRPAEQIVAKPVARAQVPSESWIPASSVTPIKRTAATERSEAPRDEQRSQKSTIIAPPPPVILASGDETPPPPPVRRPANDLSNLIIKPMPVASATNAIVAVAPASRHTYIAGPEINVALASLDPLATGPVSDAPAFADAAAPLAVAPPPMADAAQYGAITGWGKVPVLGVVDNSGQVIADARGAHRVLDLTSAQVVRNAVDNPPNGGRNGWYARNRGELALPSIHLAAGDRSLVWGEDPSDPVLDLVNSVRLSFDPAGIDGQVQMDLLSPDRTDIPAFGGVLSSVWRLDGAELLNNIDVTVRYDELARGMNEANISLWGFNGAWREISDNGASVDLADNLLYGHADSLQYIAVSTSPTAEMTASTPEPSSIVIVSIATILLARRRRRI